jgi:hypothetical protein
VAEVRAWPGRAVGRGRPVLFPMLLGMPSVRAQTAMIGMLAAMIGAVLFLIVVPDRPFAGDDRVEPTPFEDALRIMHDPAPR